MAIAIEIFTALMTVAGLVYLVLALRAGRSYLHFWRSHPLSAGYAPTISILKPMKGVDPRMLEGLRSHCVQQYDGRFEILFGITSLEDPAAAEVAKLQVEFSQLSIRLIHCPESLGTNGKLSTLTQMLPHALGDVLLVNDSDIRVSPHYLARVAAAFNTSAPRGVGMVTAPYIGAAENSLWAKVEALGISTDFFPSVLTARMLEGEVKFGLGGTLAMRREALEAIGGFAPLVNHLGDDYELGARIHAAGYFVQLAPEIVETTVPAYNFSGYWAHQLRWARNVRDARRWGYLGVCTTFALPWAIATCIASGAALWSFSLLSVVVLARVAVALTIGVGILRDAQVLRDLWLLPLRDCAALLLWAWSYASDEVVWRGERFRLQNGLLTRI